LRRVQSAFRAEGYEISIKSKPQKTVASAFVRFAGLLYELGLSQHRRQILSVKVDVDTNPPVGARTDTTLIRRHVTLNLHHYDKASLLSGVISNNHGPPILIIMDPGSRTCSDFHTVNASW
jgi:hypothetical protein